MKITKHIVSLLLLTAFVLSMFSLVSAQEKTTPVAYKTVGGHAILPVDELRPGMKGVARTVFSGSGSEEFAVEIIGVLPSFNGPRQSLIIGKLSGENVAKTGVFAGMSGSPVYVDNRLVGAIAYSFPFAKEPICGITPIEQMIEIFETGAPKIARRPHSTSLAQLARTDWKPSLPKQEMANGPLMAGVSAGSPLAPFIGQQIQPIATPVVFSGISQ